MNKKYSFDEVLSFYKELPFNIYDNIETAAAKVIENNAFKPYPIIKDILLNHKIKNIIDIGCGGGWFVNSLSANLYNKNIYGIDFNSEVIEYAQKVSKYLKFNNTFITSDLYKFKSNIKFDFISSIGVLHHTKNCHDGIKYISNLGSEGSYIFLGLYHKYGRRPFLEYFDKIKDKSEEFLLNKYSELHKLKNSKHIYSWFRDQVLNPFETQHSYKEIHELLESLNYNILSTSINKFHKIYDHKEIYVLEKELYNVGLSKINEKKYYPGFFVILAKKK